jgi:hypothetical protein
MQGYVLPRRAPSAPQSTLATMRNHLRCASGTFRSCARCRPPLQNRKYTHLLDWFLSREWSGRQQPNRWAWPLGETVHSTKPCRLRRGFSCMHSPARCRVCLNRFGLYPVRVLVCSLGRRSRKTALIYLAGMETSLRRADMLRDEDEAVKARARVLVDSHP